MGLFKNKNKHVSMAEAADVNLNPNLLRGKSDKELREIAKKVRGEVSLSGDIKAGMSDFLKGKKGTPPPPPPKRKGRSMWS
jgi:hypothetical protein